MNLYNPLPTPAGLRRCYWDADYIASQPFCITTKLTEKELKDLAAFEEDKFWERTDVLKAELTLAAQKEVVETLDQIKNDSIMEAANRGLKSLDSITSKLEEDFFLNHHQKPVINRSDFLTR